MATEREHSAGGIVVRDEECVVIVPTRRAADGSKVLALPKGHPDGAETLAQAALREVREEAGVEAETVESLGDVRYWYMRDGRRIAKVVTFFLMRHRGGSVDDHDHEVEEARWMALTEASRKLSYRGERDMAARALQRIRAGALSPTHGGL
jgi:8-oxo-dGTP pyrophosphatase MutT (NUDIX family)